MCGLASKDKLNQSDCSAKNLELENGEAVTSSLWVAKLTGHADLGAAGSALGQGQAEGAGLQMWKDGADRREDTGTTDLDVVGEGLCS